MITDELDRLAEHLELANESLEILRWAQENRLMYSPEWWIGHRQSVQAMVQQAIDELASLRLLADEGGPPAAGG